MIAGGSCQGPGGQWASKAHATHPLPAVLCPAPWTGRSLARVLRPGPVRFRPRRLPRGGGTAGRGRWADPTPPAPVDATPRPHCGPEWGENRTGRDRVSQGPRPAVWLVRMGRLTGAAGALPESRPPLAGWCHPGPRPVGARATPGLGAAGRDPSLVTPVPSPRMSPQ